MRREAGGRKMNKVIEFDQKAARKIVANNEMRAETVARLAAAIDAASQAYKSLALIQQGYVGSGLKREIAQAQSLPDCLSRAGLIVQQMIMEAGQ
jgi:hypothetical protein